MQQGERHKTDSFHQTDSKNTTLKQHLQEYGLLFNSMDVGIYVADLHSGEVLSANAAFCKMSGAIQQNALGQNCTCMHKNRNFCRDCKREAFLEQGLTARPDVREYFDSRQDKWLQIRSHPIEWPDNRLAILVTITDITDLAYRKEHYKELAYYDFQLDLPNGLKLRMDLKSLPACENCCLISFDIDNLHQINEIYDREAGDSLLLQIRDWFLCLQIPKSRLYRLAGGDFCVMVTDITPTDANLLAEQVNSRFFKPWAFKRSNQPPLPLYCAVSMSVVHGSHMFGSQDMEELLARADISSHKKGTIAIYDKEMDLNYKKHTEMQQELTFCVQQNMLGFEVYYQPIIHAQTGAWHGLEALCRWNCPHLGWVPPTVFIAEAERLGLISTLGDWVLETALGACRGWGLDLQDHFFLDVNVSPLQVLDYRLGDRVLDILEQANYPATKLTLEITESFEFYFDINSRHNINRLANAGISVALDDFGTGYSSFNNLKKLPAQILKTEKAFVDDIEQDVYTRQLFDSMVHLAHSTNKTLIAEGVETSQQRELLIRCGADYLQGYLFSRPISPADMERYLPCFGSQKSTK